MRKIRLVLMLTAIFSAQSIFANHQDSTSNSKSCTAIASACVKAGFVRPETPKKRFWQDCMKPILLGQTVEGVTINSTITKECRADKIEEFKKELKEFQQAS